MILLKYYKPVFRVLMLVFVVMVIAASTNIAFAEETKLLRLAHPDPVDSPRQEMAIKFAETLYEKTGGRFEVKVFPAGQLGGLRDVIDGLLIGTIDIVCDGPIRLQVYTDLAAIFKVPYLIRDLDHHKKVWQSEVGRELFDAITEESGISILGSGYRGARHITSNRRIEKPEDMKGLKIRVPPYDIPIQTFQMIGASPTPMDFGEVYMALQQGVMDAQENPMSANYPNRFYEVTDYLILTGHNIDVFSFLMNQNFIDGLSEADRKAFFEAADVASDHFSKICYDMEEYFIERFREEGVIVIKPDIEAFDNIWKDLIPTHYPDMEPYVNKIREVK